MAHVVSLGGTFDLAHEALALALARAGFTVCDDPSTASLHVAHEDGAVTISGTLVQSVSLTPHVAPSDVAAVVGLAAELQEALLATLIHAHDAHDVLTSILMATAELTDRVDAASRETIDDLVESCRRLATIIGQLRSLDNAGSGPQPVSITTIVSTLAPTLRSLLGKDRTLATRFAHLLPTVRIWPSDLERVLINLVTNARDATMSGDRVLVETRLVHVGRDTVAAPAGVEPGAWIVLAVEDCGAGMSEATLERAAEPFFTTKPTGRGSGMGLASVARIARLAGGHVEIDSGVGIGTTVQVWLPAAGPEAP